jgi:hypothetical protein
MDAQRANEIQALLEGVALPATRASLVEYAAAEDEAAAEELRRCLPDQEFDRIDAVGDVLLAHVGAPHAPGKLPKPESGEPPGGDAYVDANAEPGAVRPSAPWTTPAADVVDQQSQTVKKQQSKSES